MNGFLVLESGKIFSGIWRGGKSRAGEIVFNTSHSGYEEIATDPSYFQQILVMTAPMMGNYGVNKEVWESNQIYIQGFVCMEIQNSSRDSSWRDLLHENDIPILTDLDTREITLYLREQGTLWGALVQADSEQKAQSIANSLIQEARQKDRDWSYLVSRKTIEELDGLDPSGPRVAVVDFGCKNNILRNLQKRCSQVVVFPCRSSVEEIQKWNPDGILLSNGPGNPEEIQQSVENVRQLLGWRFIFGICMGHHVLALALGGKTFKLKFGHRGSNHPIDDQVLSKIYVTSQNHGYAVDGESLPASVKITHTNLNDGTVAGIHWAEKKCLSVQFHPESHPGPHDSEQLFDIFIKSVK